MDSGLSAGWLFNSVSSEFSWFILSLVRALVRKAKNHSNEGCAVKIFNLHILMVFFIFSFVATQINRRRDGVERCCERTFC